MEKQTSKSNLLHNPLVRSIAGIVITSVILGVFIYWRSTSSYIKIDSSQITAPAIMIGPESVGILAEVYVKPGDVVSSGEALARVGPETLYAKVSGLIISTNDMPGQVFSPGSAVVTMIEPDKLRVVGKIDEDKGLSKIDVGDRAIFTVDAFGNEKFVGVVDEISLTSNQSGIVFSISDKRETKQFNVKVRYDNALDARFKNGMSARLWVYTK